MTKAKAFLICLIVPYILLLIFFLSVFVLGWGALLIGPFLGLIPPASLFLLPVYVGRRWGVEYRKYGFYGSLAAGFFIAIFINLAHYYYKII